MISVHEAADKSHGIAFQRFENDLKKTQVVNEYSRIYMTWTSLSLSCSQHAESGLQNVWYSLFCYDVNWRIDVFGVNLLGLITVMSKVNNYQLLFAECSLVKIRPLHNSMPFLQLTPNKAIITVNEYAGFWPTLNPSISATETAL